jgi:hypothetical protein
MHRPLAREVRHGTRIAGHVSPGLALLDAHIGFIKQGNINPVVLGKVGDQVIHIRVQQAVPVQACDSGFHLLALMLLDRERVCLEKEMIVALHVSLSCFFRKQSRHP